MWLRYKNKYSSTSYYWRFLGDISKKEAEDYVVPEILDELHNSIMYGCTIEYDIVETPPVNVLEKEIKKVENKIKYQSATLNFMIAKLEEAQALEKFGITDAPNSWKP